MTHLRKLCDRAAREVKNLELDSLDRFGLERRLESYYLIGPYPPLAAMQRPSQESIETLIAQLSQPIDLYIHFPFCRVMGPWECSFCHFYKVPYDPNTEKEYVDACIKEIAMYRRRLGRIQVRSVYFGGGTFSLISRENLHRLLAFIWTELDVDSLAEVKFEVHADAARTPELLTEVICGLREYPITHLVLDIQTLNENSLRMVSWGRVRPRDYFDTLQLCRDLGIERFVTGLILGLPLETKESFLDGVLSLATLPDIVTINIFPLMLKSGDAIHDQYLRLPELFPDVAERDIMHYAARVLLRGLSFSESPLYFMNRAGSSPHHQTHKFEGLSLLGIGPSAFGTFHGSRSAQYYNVPSLNAYLRRINEGTLPIWRLGEMSAEGWQRRQLILGFLNLNRDLDPMLWNSDCPERDALEFFCDIGLLKSSGSTLALTDKGLLRTEEMSWFLAESSVRDALRLSNGHEDHRRYNYFITRTADQEQSFRSAMKASNRPRGVPVGVERNATV